MMWTVKWPIIIPTQVRVSPLCFIFHKVDGKWSPRFSSGAFLHNIPITYFTFYFVHFSLF